MNEPDPAIVDSKNKERFQGSQTGQVWMMVELQLIRGVAGYFYLESILKEGLPCTDTEMNPLIVLIVLKSVQY